MREHFMSVKRTARYVTLGDPESARQVWLVCHGYGQLASRFIRYFSVLDNGHSYIVAPEGLSRFYVDAAEGEHGPASKVGATWMTREDRFNEINDYVRYLNKVYDAVFSAIDRTAVEVIVLGFSQGAATACRWIDFGHARVDQLIVWGGYTPRDIDPVGAFKEARLKLVYGEKDEVVTPQQLRAQESWLAESHLDYELVRFEGGHHLNQYVLKTLAGETEDSHE